VTDRRKHACRDHRGNLYESKTAMCREWNVSVSTYEDRIKAGGTVEQALTATRFVSPAAPPDGHNCRPHNWSFCDFDDGQERHRCLRCGMLSTWPGGRDWCVGFQKNRDRMAEERRRLRESMPWL